MKPGQTSSLQLPSFLHGTYPEVQQKTQREGLRCGEHYRKDGSLPSPAKLLEVRPGEAVVTQDLIDFYRERSAWRLYMVSNVKSSLCEALDWPDTYEVDDHYEAFCRETAWGALYFAIAQTAPKSAERMALRLQALLRFWEPLQSARYLFNSPNDTLTLDELMMAARDWAMDAWCPEGDASASVRERLERAAERMARATREESIEAILRQLPRVLTSSRGLKHRDVLADPGFQRERLAQLDVRAFERVSGACTSDILALLHAWDRQIGKQ
ncbi:hypothetical protein F0U60_32565 [Archangium minus]|uniref:Uncharacterized protein n=1 Tax=Archangium minus TaxID=83450 RepID=A0ABY9WYY4_9BACT|nr:hypothetical protein F0U60_32565 [Archangium minus]